MQSGSGGWFCVLMRWKKDMDLEGVLSLEALEDVRVVAAGGGCPA